MDGLIEGRIVHFVLPNGEHRPAMIVKNWNEQSGCSNLTVFTDWTNDAGYSESDREALINLGMNPDKVASGMVWMTSRSYSEKMEPGTWHWIERT
jgi:hypothetical protein